MGPGGSWMAYSVMSDAIMLSALMSRNNYYYDSAAYNTSMARHNSAPVAGQGWSFMAIFGIICVVCIVVGVSICAFTYPI
jgi:hypothetical protein